jgi:hypothetical protein
LKNALSQVEATLIQKLPNVFGHRTNAVIGICREKLESGTLAYADIKHALSLILDVTDKTKFIDSLSEDQADIIARMLVYKNEQFLAEIKKDFGYFPFSKRTKEQRC